MYTRCLKRVLDIILSVIAIILLALPMIIIALAIKWEDNRTPVIFKQTRVGRNGTTFKILKFRSMKSDVPHHLSSSCITAEEYQDYVTNTGKWLRRTSLDELPQVFNILRGEMSFVGPRPVVLKERSLLEARERAGLKSFRPGLTGLAQISGRNMLTDEEKAAYDAEYAEKISFLFDTKCIICTIYIVITKKGFLEGNSDRLDRNADFEDMEDTDSQDSCSTGR